MLKYRQLLPLLTLIISVSSYSFDLYGHRGARGLMPENTLPAYKKALALKVDYVDMDIALTKDHVVVVQHDITLNPDITRDAHQQWLTDRTHFIKNMTLKEIQTYDVGRIKPGTQYAAYFPNQQAVDGTHIPTLKEVIEYVKATAGDRVGFQIEIKTDPTKPDATYAPEEMAAAVAKVIAEEGIVQRVQLQAFDWRCLQAMQKINPAIATAYLTDVPHDKLMRDENPQIAGLWTSGKLLKDYHGSIPQMVKALGGKYWDPQDIELSADQVREAHKLGLKVIAWTNPVTSGKDVEVTMMEKLIAMGVDGIITDRPDVVKSLKK